MLPSPYETLRKQQVLRREEVIGDYSADQALSVRRHVWAGGNS